MKRLLNIIPVIVFISFVMVFSNSCINKSKQEQSETYLIAKKYFKDAYRMLNKDIVDNDSIVDAFPKLIEVLRLLEVLPEDMTIDEMSLVSTTYINISLVFFSKGEPILETEAAKRALDYQKYVNDTNEIARLAADLALIYSALGDAESSQYYIDYAAPYLDTMSDFVEPYLKTRTALEYSLFFQEKYDSSFRVNIESIAFKHRRGMDTKNDSVALGMSIFESPYKHLSKPFLLKIFDIDRKDISDVSRGIAMNYLAQIYEEENNTDSLTICQKFFVPYAEAQFQRSQNVVGIKQLYEDYKVERDAKLDTLRKQKDLRKQRINRIVICVVLMSLVVSLIIILRHINHRKSKTQRRIIDDTLRQNLHTIYNNKKNNIYQIIINEIDLVYPKIIDNVRQSYPELTETEADICLLSFFSFRVKEIAIILNLRENTISKYRSSIIKKTGISVIGDVLKPFV